MIISPAQSRAARGLLDLSQTKAAMLMDVSQSSLSYFENEELAYDHKLTFIHKVWRFYDENNIEFGVNDGVRWKSTGLKTLKGYEGFKSFIQDVYETVKLGGDVCVTNVDESQFQELFGDYGADYMEKMSQIENLNFRILVKEGDDNFLASRYAQYRRLPSQYFGSVPTYTYGTKRAEIYFDYDPVEVLVIDNPQSADAQRKHFEMMWEQSSEPI